MPRERYIQRATMEALSAIPGVFVIKIHGGPYQVAGLPDLLVLCAGRAAFVEMKRHGESMTKIQQAMEQKINNVGVPVITATSAKDAASAVKQWLSRE